MKSEDIIKKAKEAPKKVASELDLVNKPEGLKVRPTYKNALYYLNVEKELKGLFRYNEFSNHVEFTKKPVWGIYGEYPKPINDFDILALKTYFINNCKVEFSVNTINEAVTHYATRNSYDPVKDYLTSLTWDKKKRVDGWLHTYFGVKKDKYSDTVGNMTLCAACARVDKPGIKYDYMIILEGEQDLGKSLACSILGGAYYREISLIERSKETVEKMQGAWIIEVPELAVFKKKDIESLKSFITSANDSERLPYGRRSMIFPRRNIFVGTINPDNTGYLTDTTGNRRFLPVLCQKIDLGALQRDRDQLWAEAWQLYQAGQAMYLNREITNLAISEQGGRQIIDEWVEAITSYVQYKERVSSLDIWKTVLGGSVSKFDRLSQCRIANCLKILGFTRTTYRDDEGVTIKGFKRPDQNVQHLTRNQYGELIDPEKMEWDE